MRRKVAAVGITRQAVRDKIGELFEASFLAGLPVLSQSAGPIGPRGKQAQFLKGQSVRRAGMAVQMHRREQGTPWLSLTLECPPEWAVDAVRPAVSGLEKGWFVQQVTVETFGDDAGLGKTGFQRAVDGNARREMPTIPVYFASAGLLHNLRQHIAGRTGLDHQPRAEIVQTFVKRRKAVMQHPALRAAERADAFGHLVMNVECDHRATARRRCV